MNFLWRKIFLKLFLKSAWQVQFLGVLFICKVKRKELKWRIQENFYAELCDIFHQLRNLQEDAQLLGWVKTEKEMDYLADEVLYAIKSWQKEIVEKI